MRSRTLGRILLGAITASLASCGGGTEAPSTPSGATSSGASSGNTSSSGGTPTAFDCSTAQGIVDALRTATGADYVSLRKTDADLSVPTPLDKLTIVAESGTACSGAADAASCHTALKALAPTGDLARSSGGNMAPLAEVLVYTKGNRVAFVGDRATALSLVGTVDAPAEAWLIAEVDTLGTAYCAPGVVETVSDGFVVNTRMDCGAEAVRVGVGADGTVKELSRQKNDSCGCACVGRRPAGLVARRGRRATNALAAHFVEMSELEAASVDAFTVLRRELAAHGAPPSLRRAAARSARDEVKHARMTARLARRFGGEPEPPVIAPAPVRSLYEIALENAIEGCIRETYGALEATWQARAAEDPSVKAAMEIIARDETRHGALAWRVAAWIEPLLSAEERSAVERARADEAEALARRVASAEHAPELVRRAGLPDRDRAVSLVRALDERLFRSDAA